mmetsp:Transcript_15562/g.33708  ORF Transcript_15562/g.33708 Transcript_15562/m.33708 type:complete len:116 (+) Transcript_15562:38-385(+)
MTERITFVSLDTFYLCEGCLQNPPDEVKTEDKGEVRQKIPKRIPQQGKEISWHLKSNKHPIRVNPNCPLAYKDRAFLWFCIYRSDGERMTSSLRMFSFLNYNMCQAIQQNRLGEL